MTPPQDTSLSPQQMADLAALADGTLEAGRRPEIEALIAGSPELRRLYERERRVVGVLRGSAAAERAPDALRARVGALRPDGRAARRRRLGLTGALAGALAAVAAALALVLPAGAPGSPSVSQAAALALRGPAAAAPGLDPSRPATHLSQNVDELYFPNWGGALGWRATGQRSDELGGRRAITVFYTRAGKWVAYTIVGGSALPEPAGRSVTIDGLSFKSLTAGRLTGVSWRERGHTCVLSGPGARAEELQRLAGWTRA